jgi:hypothetical protein
LQSALRLARQRFSGHDASQVGPDERDVRSGHGQVGAGADGDAQVGLGQGGGLVGNSLWPVVRSRNPSERKLRFEGMW